MSYKFFLSHARRDADKYLRRFHDDLMKEVAQRTNQWDHTGFRDARDIETGEWWETKLGTALSRSQVLVFVSSPSAIASSWCGKEWAGFYSRCVDYQRVHRLSVPPALILPVTWVPAPAMPAAVDALQSDHEAPGLEEVSRLYKEKGLLYLIKLRPKLYQKFLDQLAKDLVEVAAKHPLTNHPYPANFSTVESAFPPLSPDRVCAQFIYIVPCSAEIGACRKRLEAYAADTKRWKPFYPPSESDAATIAYRASQQENFNYEDVPLGDLEDQIRQAANDNKVLILMIDAWAFKIAKYRALMASYEHKHGRNCVLVVPWNLKDSETNLNSGALWETVVATLRKATTPDDQAIDPDELHAKLVRGLIRGRKGLLETARVRGGLPEGDVPLAFVSAVKEG